MDGIKSIFLLFFVLLLSASVLAVDPIAQCAAENATPYLDMVISSATYRESLRFDHVSAKFAGDCNQPPQYMNGELVGQRISKTGHPYTTTTMVRIGEGQVQFKNVIDPLAAELALSKLERLQEVERFSTEFGGYSVSLVGEGNATTAKLEAKRHAPYDVRDLADEYVLEYDFREGRFTGFALPANWSDMFPLEAKHVKAYPACENAVLKYREQEYYNRRYVSSRCGTTESALKRNPISMVKGWWRRL